MDGSASISRSVGQQTPSLECLEDRALLASISAGPYFADQLHPLADEATSAARMATDAGPIASDVTPAMAVYPVIPLRPEAAGGNRLRSDGAGDQTIRSAGGSGSGQLWDAFGGSFPISRAGDRSAAPNERDEALHRGEYRDPAEDRDEPANSMKGAVRADSSRLSEMVPRYELGQAPIEQRTWIAASADNLVVVLPTAPAASAAIGNIVQPVDRAVNFPGATATSDRRADTSQRMSDQLTAVVPSSEAELTATVRPSGQIRPETAGNIEPPSAPSGTHPVDGWLPIDLRAVERGVSALLNRLGALGDEESRDALVRDAICVVGVWAAYEFARSRRRPASDGPLPDWLAGLSVEEK
jgi:hypothetical protein